MSERSGVEIDYCPQCRGVWLDRGELDKIIERANAQLAAEAPRSDERDRREGERRDRDPEQKKPKKKTSFLSEIFESFGE